MPDVKFVVVLVAALAANTVGFLWFSPLVFEDRWMRAIGKDPADTAEMGRLKQSIAPLFAFVLIGWLGSAYVLAVILAWAGVQSAQKGMAIALLIWVGLVLPAVNGAVIFGGRPRSVMGTMIGIEGTGQLLAFAVMGAILGAWR